MRISLNPSNPSSEAEVEGGRTAARALGVELRVLPARTERELDESFSALKDQRVDALVVSPDPFFDSRRDRLVTLAAQLAIPAKYGWREYVVAGGLMSYGTNLPDSYRRAGVYVGRILKGEKPADIPVQLPTRFEFVVNVQTAKTIGIEIPAALLARADEVIE